MNILYNSWFKQHEKMIKALLETIENNSPQINTIKKLLEHEYPKIDTITANENQKEQTRLKQLDTFFSYLKPQLTDLFDEIEQLKEYQKELHIEHIKRLISSQSNIQEQITSLLPQINLYASKSLQNLNTLQEENNHQTALEDKYTLEQYLTINSELKKYYGKSFEWYKKHAENGDNEAMYWVARCYEQGKEIELDYNKALEWYTSSANKGNLDAIKSLVLIYQEGKCGIKVDISNELIWKEKLVQAAQEQKDQRAGLYMIRLASDYSSVDSEFTNYGKALFWLKEASNICSHGMCLLGNLYAKENTEIHNLAQAAQCYHKAAENNNSEAMYYLADAYEKGKGVEQDFTKAIKWYIKSAENEDIDAMRRLAHLYETGKLNIKKNIQEAIRWNRTNCSL